MIKFKSRTSLLSILLFINLYRVINASSCSNNKIPYGLEVYADGRPSLMCSKPTCFSKSYADCDETPLSESCPVNDTWIGGVDKGRGLHQPLYLQCCEFENLDTLSDLMFTNVIIRPGEYFEGEELSVIEHGHEKVTSFDFISKIKMIKEGAPNNRTIAFVIDVRRFHCNRYKRSKIVKNWSWP